MSDAAKTPVSGGTERKWSGIYGLQNIILHLYI